MVTSGRGYRKHAHELGTDGKQYHELELTDYTLQKYSPLTLRIIHSQDFFLEWTQYRVRKSSCLLLYKCLNKINSRHLRIILRCLPYDCRITVIIVESRFRS